MLELLTGASLRQQAGVAKAAAKAERSRRVTKAHFFSFVPPAQRPWPEQSAGHVRSVQLLPVHPGRHAHVPL